MESEHSDSFEDYYRWIVKNKKNIGLDQCTLRQLRMEIESLMKITNIIYTKYYWNNKKKE